MEKNENRNLMIHQAAREVYGLDTTPFTKLGSFESEIWEVNKNHSPLILRITDGAHRTIPELLSEASWIHFLSKNNVPCVTVIPTLQGNNCFSLADPSIHLMLFTKACGHGPTTEDVTMSLIEEWGALLGRMHRLSLRFRPDERFIRSYTENIVTSHFNKVADKINPLIQKKYSSLLIKCMEFPVSHKHYGLIHSDLHLGNFFIDQGHMVIFDFDDLQLGWFVFDIAIALYYIFWNSDLKEETWYQDSGERSEKAKYFLTHLFKGYQEEFRLPACWFQMIPFFLELRQLDLYLVFKDRFGDSADLSTMPVKLLNQYEQRILNQVPFMPQDVFDPAFYSIK
jgi:Ser/Thr protein kinase RdoA (MazF antagonist)